MVLMRLQDAEVARQPKRRSFRSQTAPTRGKLLYNATSMVKHSGVQVSSCTTFPCGWTHQADIVTAARAQAAIAAVQPAEALLVDPDTTATHSTAPHPLPLLHPGLTMSSSEG